MSLNVGIGIKSLIGAGIVTTVTAVVAASTTRTAVSWLAVRNNEGINECNGIRV